MALLAFTPWLVAALTTRRGPASPPRTPAHGTRATGRSLDQDPSTYAEQFCF